MNYHVIAKFTGLLMIVFGISMAPALMVSIGYSDGAVWSFVISMLITIALGGIAFYWGNKLKQDIFRREAMAIVGLAWACSAFAGALPYNFSGLEEVRSFAGCYFEAMSGLTTTGATIFTEIESLPKSILFWRGWTHWVGGVGIIMLFIAVLPYLGTGGRALVQSEVTGPVKDGLTPRIKDTAYLLLKVYIAFTVLETACLMFAGMDLFEALVHTFATLATGGFSTRNSSLAGFQSPLIEFVVIVFMIFAGTNFALIHRSFGTKRILLLKDVEWKFYIGIIIGATLFIVFMLMMTGTYTDINDALRDSMFTVVSVMTTTGFVTADFEQWPVVVKMLLAVIMFIGGCAGSTGGGMKVIRWLILFKIANHAVEKVFNPRRIRKIKIGGNVLDEEIQQQTLTFALLWMLILVTGAMLIAISEGDKMDMITPIATSIATLNNIGPGFSLVAATANFGHFEPATHWIISLLMLLGRIELYSILVLLIPRFWHPST